jgi:hypothetical protein
VRCKEYVSLCDKEAEAVGITDVVDGSILLCTDVERLHECCLHRGILRGQCEVEHVGEIGEVISCADLLALCSVGNVWFDKHAAAGLCEADLGGEEAGRGPLRDNLINLIVGALEHVGDPRAEGSILRPIFNILRPTDDHLVGQIIQVVI